jgi:hypothetical protein
VQAVTVFVLNGWTATLRDAPWDAAEETRTIVAAASRRRKLC